MYITQKQLYQLLRLNLEKQKGGVDQETLVSISSEGPGEYDFWGTLEGRTDNYLQFSYSSHLRKKKKIILSYTPHVDELYIAFFNAILRDKDLELAIWTAKGLVQITNLQELSNALELIQTASADQIREALLYQQNSSVQDCIFLDAHHYASIKKAEVKSENPENAINQVSELFSSLQELTHIDLADEDAAKVTEASLLYPKQITSLDFSNIRYNHMSLEIQQRLRDFPNTQKIMVSCEDDSLISPILLDQSLRDKSIEISFFYPDADYNFEDLRGLHLKELVIKKLTLEKTTQNIIFGHSNIQSLSLTMSNERKDCYYNVSFAAVEKLESLELTNFNFSKLQFPTHCSELQQIKLSGNLPNLDLSKLNNLKVLSLISKKPSKILWPIQPSFTDLSLSLFFWESLPQKHHGHLETLSFTYGEKKSPPLNLTHCNNLTHLSLKTTETGAWDISKVSWPTKNRVTTLELESDDTTEILDLSSFENLEKIVIKKYSKLRKIIWPTNKHQIKDIKLVNCPNLKKLDVTNFSDLKSIFLEDCQCQLEFNQATSIDRLFLKELHLEECLDLSHAGHVNILILDKENAISKMKLNPSLRELQVHSNTKLDMSSCQYLEKIYLNSENDSVSSLSGKNELIKEFKSIGSTQLLLPPSFSFSLKKAEKISLERYFLTAEIIQQLLPNEMAELDLNSCACVDFLPYGETVLNLSHVTYIGHLVLTISVFEKIIFSPGVVIDNITIIDCFTVDFLLPQRLDLSPIKGLQNLTLQDSSNVLQSIEMPKDNMLRSLVLRNIDTHLFHSFSQFTRLQNISIINIQDSPMSSKIDLRYLTNLTNATILCEKDNAIPLEIDLTGCTNLEVAEVMNRDKSELYKPVLLYGLDDCQNLKKLEFSCSNLADAKSSFLKNLPAQCKLISSGHDQPTPIQNQYELALDYANNKNPVSVFNFRDGIGVSPYTDKVKPAVSQGDFKVNLYSKRRPVKETYRIQRLDRCFFDVDGKIKFVSSQIPPEKIVFRPDSTLTFEKIKQQADENPSIEAGSMEGKFFQPEKYYPLINSAAVERSDAKLSQRLICNKPELIDIFWDKSAQRYCFKLKEGIEAQALEFYYCSVLDQNYSSESTPEKYHASEVDPKVRNVLREMLIKKLENNDELKSKLGFLFAPEINCNEKIKKLKSYCKAIQPNPAANQATDDIGTIVDQIVYQYGHCLQKSQAFMLLASLIDVNVSIIINENHAFCELSTEDGHLQSCQLGGTSYLDITSAEARGEDVFKSKIERKEHVDEKKEEKSKTQNATRFAIVNDKKQADQDAKQSPSTSKKLLFMEGIKKLSAIKSVSSFQQLETIANHLTPLILLKKAKENNHADELKTIEQLLLNTTAKTLVISRPEDFEMYFKPPTLLNGVQGFAPSGPLRQMIHSREKVLIIVNWSTFPPEKIAAYQSILDTSAKLFDEKITNPNLRFIGIKSVDEADANDTAFLSRCQRVRLSPEFFAKQMPETKPEAKVQEITVDLNYQPYWRDALWGKCDGHSIKESDLIKALRQEPPVTVRLIVKNKPKNAYDLEMFLLRLQHEKRFLFNGEILQVKAPITVQFRQENVLENSENIRIHLSEEKDIRQPIFLNINNLYECDHQLVYTADHRMVERPGHFAGDLDQVIFYLTSSISFNEWQSLKKKIDAITKNFPEKIVHFKLAPGVQIGSVASNTASPSIEAGVSSKGNQLIVSNDPEYFVALLRENDELIYDITLNHKASDLLAKAFVKDAEHHYQEQIVLRELAAGRTVILNGPLSPALYQSLLPLLANPPRFFSNGRFLPEPGKPWGRLLIVMPPPEPNFVFVSPVVRCMFDLEDYRNFFVPKEKHDSKIFQFLKDAERVPCMQGTLVSYELIDWMRARLNDPKLHKQNPVKGKTTYRYPKGSDEYAYINVLGKYYFADADETPARFRKIHRLKAHYDIETLAEFKLHVWKILNCFHGKELRVLLGSSLDKIVTVQKDSHPILDEKIVNDLFYNHFQPIIGLDPKTLPPEVKDFEKRIIQLKTLLNDPKTRLIIHRGPPGTSKTHVVRYGLEKHFENIVQWLEAKPKDDKDILALQADEANLLVPGTWDFLKGLLRSGVQKVIYKDKEYILTPQHKIIATMNPDTDPGRSPHALFQRGEEIYFSKPTPDFLEKFILEKFLPSHLNKPDYKECLLDAYVTLEKICPHRMLSYRDMESLVSRFVMLCSIDPVNKEDFYKNALYKACSVEFAGSIKDAIQRKNYLLHLQKHILGSEKPPIMLGLERLSPDHAITTDKLYLVDALSQFIAQMQYLSSFPDLKLVPKKLVLIQGSPGVGKSLIAATLLKKFHVDYVHINAGTQEAREKLREAFFKGQTIVIDELNVDLKLMKVLNYYLMGDRAPDDPLDKIVPGFNAIATTNSEELIGRHLLAPALQSRIQLIYHDDYSLEELECFAAIFKDGKDFAAAFFECMQADSGINMRIFHRLLKHFVEKGVIENIPLFDASLEKTSHLLPQLPTNIQKNINELYELAKLCDDQSTLAMLDELQKELCRPYQLPAMAVSKIEKNWQAELVTEHRGKCSTLWQSLLNEIRMLKAPIWDIPSTDDEMLGKLNNYFEELQKKPTLSQDEGLQFAALLKIQKALEHFSGSLPRAADEIRKNFPEGITGNLNTILEDFFPFTRDRRGAMMTSDAFSRPG